MSHNYKLIDCHDDRDPISMSIFWIEENKIKKIIYPETDLKQLVFYTDSKNLVRCFEKESLRYMKTYGLSKHPITLETIPEHIFENLETIHIIQVEDKSIENFALDIFQKFSNISIYLDYEWFLELDKTKLLKFHNELKDFWRENLSQEQKNQITDSELFSISTESLINDSLEDIQKYLLNIIKKLLECELESLKFMINYIILGAFCVVVPKIKELYPDFLFDFQ
jgi:hypothetical protein